MSNDRIKMWLKLCFEIRWYKRDVFFRSNEDAQSGSMFCENSRGHLRICKRPRDPTVRGMCNSRQRSSIEVSRLCKKSYVGPKLLPSCAVAQRNDIIRLAKSDCNRHVCAHALRNGFPTFTNKSERKLETESRNPQCTCAPVVELIA